MFLLRAQRMKLRKQVLGTFHIMVHTVELVSHSQNKVVSLTYSIQKVECF